MNCVHEKYVYFTVIYTNWYKNRSWIFSWKLYNRNVHSPFSAIFSGSTSLLRGWLADLLQIWLAGWLAVYQPTRQSQLLLPLLLEPASGRGGAWHVSDYPSVCGIIEKFRWSTKATTGKKKPGRNRTGIIEQLTCCCCAALPAVGLQLGRETNKTVGSLVLIRSRRRKRRRKSNVIEPVYNVYPRQGNSFEWWCWWRYKSSTVSTRKRTWTIYRVLLVQRGNFRYHLHNSRAA